MSSLESLYIFIALVLVAYIYVTNTVCFFQFLFGFSFSTVNEQGEPPVPNRWISPLCIHPIPTVLVYAEPHKYIAAQ